VKLDLSTLNQNQLDAVNWNDGPLLVLAGPGSGKTRVLTFRIARLLVESPGERFKLLGITFTNKAAAEMRERLEGLVSSGRERLLVTTFHSFAADLLRQHGTHVGLKPDFAILSQPADREAVLSEVISELEINRDELAGDAARILPAVDAVLDKQVAEGGATNVSQDIKRIADAYVERLIKSNQMDFATLLIVAVRLLRDKPFVAQQVRRVFKYVCVDEFQDTNAAQFELLLLIVPQASPNLFIVADDDQIIYEWNGASPQRLQTIAKHFGMAIVQLPENYRCPPQVIDIANRLIAQNKDRAQNKLPLIAHKPDGTEVAVSVIDFDSSEEEAAWLAVELEAFSPLERTRCAVLARTRKLLEGAVDQLTKAGIPAHLSLRKTEFESAPIRWEHSVLRLANARQDREFLRRTCKAFYEYEGVELSGEDVVAAASQHAGDYLRAWMEMAVRTERIDGPTKKFLEDSVRPLLEKNDFGGFMGVCAKWFADPGFYKIVADDLDAGLLKEELSTWTALSNDIESKFGRDELTLNTFLQELDLCSKEPPPPKNAVRCLTIHTSKGMEFERVYLIGLAEDVLPSWAAVKKGDQSREMREERRNCFVAITRAEKHLTLSYARRYNGYPKAPSRFLVEMGLVRTR
jgi:DNA helicase-2/ATP-dependent DNA helicase PcrA